MNQAIKKAFLLAALALSHAGCVFYPRQADLNDAPDCKVISRQLELDMTVLSNFSCGNGDPLACVAVIGALGAGSAAVSGSVVVVNNTLHWLEKKGRCAEKKG